jgi:hypothetical protein
MPSDSTLPFSVAHGHAVALRTYARNVERGTVPTDTMSPSKVARLADEIAAAVEDMRDLAAEHEREVRAALQARIDKALALHRETKIYDECGHKHKMADDYTVPAGLHLIEEVGLTCEDGYQYSICRECCTDDGYQTETCVDNHEHGGSAACWPCPTHACLAGDTTPAAEVQIDTRDWVMLGETIIDDPEEYRLGIFVPHGALPEIIAAYLKANKITAPAAGDTTEVDDA